MPKTNATENEQQYVPYKSHVNAGLVFLSHHPRITLLESCNIWGGDIDLLAKESGGNIRSQTNQVLEVIHKRDLAQQNECPRAWFTAYSFLDVVRSNAPCASNQLHDESRHMSSSPV